MSIEVNGVTLPDIPSEVLERYPYAVIYHSVFTGSTNEETYALLMGKDEGAGGFRVVPPGSLTAMGYDYGMLMAGGEMLVYEYSADTSAWVGLEDISAYEVNLIGELTQTTGSITITQTGELLWANHDVLSLAVDEDGNPVPTDEIYFARNDSDPNYFAPKSWFDGMARQVMRLTGTSDKMNTDKMLELAKGVEVGGGGGLTFETSASGTTS